jgi:hypothetical protein
MKQDEDMIPAAVRMLPVVYKDLRLFAGLHHVLFFSFHPFHLFIPSKKSFFR